MHYVFYALGTVLVILGFIGCVLPVLPGPQLAYISLLVLQAAKDPSPFSKTLLLVLGIVNVVVFVMDYVLPLWGAKIGGASRPGMWGAMAGMLIGLIFFPPFGMILGILAGAVIGELAAGKEGLDALVSGSVSFIFSILAIFLKLATTAVVAFFFFKGLFS